MLVQQLPIYNKTRQFVRDYICVYEKMRNLHKHRLGAYIYDKALGLSWYLKKANRNVSDASVRNAYIEDFLDELDSVVNGVRLAYECRIIDVKAHARLSGYLVEIGKQATAWKNGRPKDNQLDCQQSKDVGREP